MYKGYIFVNYIFDTAGKFLCDENIQKIYSESCSQHTNITINWQQQFHLRKKLWKQPVYNRFANLVLDATNGWQIPCNKLQHNTFGQRYYFT